jgi:hypothetical protein
MRASPAWSVRIRDALWDAVAIDPRTLAVARVCVAVLLLVDLVKRALSLELWYADTGLMPAAPLYESAKHTGLYSVFWFITDPTWLALSFGAIGLVYLGLLVGYRTKVCQVLALVSLVSLQARVSGLCNGGDFVHCALLWWTAFLPMGRRFSVDAVLASYRGGATTDSALGRRVPRDTRPFRSLAVVGALLQLSVIYWFNAIHKDGVTWKQGTAIYYFIQQERILTPIGLWARHHVPFGVTRTFTYGALGLELSLPFLILSPVYRAVCRRAAIFGILALHLGIATLANLGVFSPVMCVFSMLLWTPEHWRSLRRWARRRHRAVLEVNARSPRAVTLAHLLARLDTFERLELRVVRKKLRSGRLGLVAYDERGRRHRDEAGLAQACRALPFGAWWSRVLGPARLAGVAGAIAERLARRSSSERDVRPFSLRFARPLAFVREALTIPVLLLAGAQLLHENRAIPSPVQIKHPPAWMDQMVWATRLRQGWGMFAPDAPKTERTVVVDAETVDGRHLDPVHELASGDAHVPSLDRVPIQPGYDVYWTSWAYRAPETGSWKTELGRWLRDYHVRSGRAEDRFVRFTVYLVTQDSPDPGEPGPKNVKARVILRGP